MAADLLALESAPDSPKLVDQLFREAHTLKGGAGLVGLTAVSHLAHRLEDLLEELRRGTRAATPELVDSLLQAVDGLGTLIGSAGDGKENTELATALGNLLPQAPSSKPVARSGPKPKVHAAPRPNPEPAPNPAPEPGPPLARAAAAPAAGPASFDSDHLQVPMARMDELFNLVGEAAAAQMTVGHMVSTRLGVDPESVSEYRDLTRTLNRLRQVMMATRMVPVGTVGPVLHRTVRDLARSIGKDVRWEVRGGDSEIDRSVLERLVDPLQHIVRNCVVHGIESPEQRAGAGKPAQATVRLHAMQLGSEVVIAVVDDGAGIDVEAVRSAAGRRGYTTTDLDDEEVLDLIFRTGVSTAETLTEVAGRGVGLDVVAAALESVRGRIEVRNDPGHGAEFRLIVPITLAILPCLIVSVGGQSLAIPMSGVVRVMDLEVDELTAGGRPLTLVGEQAIGMSGLGAALGLPAAESGPWVILSSNTRTHAFRVDRLVARREVVVRGLGKLLARFDTVIGASIEPDGSILLILDVAALLERVGKTADARVSSAPLLAGRAARTPYLLVVDDALTVRELQRAILERAGYEVRTANDGQHALALLAERLPDLVVTDVEMPVVDGFELCASIRRHPKLASIPILMVTSRSSEEDRRRGLEAGADGYIVKSAFDQTGLLNAIAGLLGRHS